MHAFACGLCQGINMCWKLRLSTHLSLSEIQTELANSVKNKNPLNISKLKF